MLSCLLIHKSILKQAVLTPLLQMRFLWLNSVISFHRLQGRGVCTHWWQTPALNFPVSALCSRRKLFPVTAGSIRDKHWLHKDSEYHKITVFVHYISSWRDIPENIHLYSKKTQYKSSGFLKQLYPSPQRKICNSLWICVFLAWKFLIWTLSEFLVVQCCLYSLLFCLLLHQKVHLSIFTREQLTSCIVKWYRDHAFRIWRKGTKSLQWQFTADQTSSD